MLRLVKDSNDVYLLLSDNNDIHYYKYDGSSNTWDASYTTLEDTVLTFEQLGVNPVSGTNGIDYVFSDSANGVIKFNTLSLGGAPTPTNIVQNIISNT
jgi:hypothetical protein